MRFRKVAAMPMPKNHRVYDYDYVAFARLVREGMDRLCLTRNRFGTLAALDTRTLDRVLAGRGVNDGVRQKVVDGLKRRSTQIKVALDFERLAAAARPGPHRYSRREAIRFSTAGFTVLAVETGNGPARSTRDDGLSVSPTSSTTAMALEKAQLALKFWESDAWDAGLKFCEESLVALGIVDFSPEQPAPISLREAEFRNRWGQSDYETALRAYAQLAQIYGFARHARGKFELAKRTYATWVDVSRLLGDGSMTADALRFLSRSTFEQAVHVEPEDVAWRVPRDPQSILRSIEIVGEAHSTRPKNDASHRVADDWRTEARYRQLVLVFARDIRALNQARHAWEEARAAISEDTSRANVHLLQDEARWHLSEVRISTARDVYQEALHIARIGL
jgi:hypothetical protein